MHQLEQVVCEITGEPANPFSEHEQTGRQISLVSCMSLGFVIFIVFSFFSIRLFTSKLAFC
ncbi:hypothetical protein, partial [Xanthomonas oryzae]|uniref:hypothetical protein n=1 Tax=Xanthomonas oryzae TaxID=347 RepID=UPI001C49F11A